MGSVDDEHVGLVGRCVSSEHRAGRCTRSEPDDTLPVEREVHSHHGAGFGIELVPEQPGRLGDGVRETGP